MCIYNIIYIYIWRERERGERERERDLFYCPWGRTGRSPGMSGVLDSMSKLLIEDMFGMYRFSTNVYVDMFGPRSDRGQTPQQPENLSPPPDSCHQAILRYPVMFCVFFRLGQS